MAIRIHFVGGGTRDLFETTISEAVAWFEPESGTAVAPGDYTHEEGVLILLDKVTHVEDLDYVA